MNFIDLTQISPASVGYISKVFDDFKPILTIVIGLIIGFFILEMIMDLIEDFLAKRTAREEYERELEIEAVRPVMKEFHEHEVERKREEIIKEA
jgi:hypothetical protein